MDCMRNHFIDGVLLNNRYKTVSALNHGSFGLVFKAEDVLTGQLVALKCMIKPSAAATSATQTFAVDDKSEELAIHRLVGSHPSIVNFVDEFETDNHVYLVLEFCPNGDLYEAIRLGRGPGQTDNIREAMLQLIDAVEFMHSVGVYHRDIKPENIFLAADGSIKLGDFGLATRDTLSYESAVGSDRYMAPEQMESDGNGYSPAKADIWAIGICLLNILFSRNPFATPTLSDPLFADFAADRQSLFDIFPSMSEDTFSVLTHSLALDPESRDLAAVRNAIVKAINFTTDDETLDDFCVAPVTRATANREPLRTPSISSPHIDQGGAFPWAKALAMTSPVRQLSVIQDVDLTHEIFSDDVAEVDYYRPQPDSASVVSFVDSGLGVSIESSVHPKDMVATRTKALPITGSLPVTAGRPIPSLSAIFGKKAEFQSKSWSDLWDEDFEEENEVHVEPEQDHDFFAGRPSMETLSSVSHGSNTPRNGLAELDPEIINNSRVRTPEDVHRLDDNVSEHTGFLFEEDNNDSMAVKTPAPEVHDPQVYAPPSKRSILDKWAALGDRRRNQTPFRTPFSSRAVSQHPITTPTPINITTTPQKRSRQGSNTGRKGINWNMWGRTQNKEETPPLSNYKRDWNISKDWRNHSQYDKPLHSTAQLEADRIGQPHEWVWRI